MLSKSQQARISSLFSRTKPAAADLGGNKAAAGGPADVQVLRDQKQLTGGQARQWSE